MTQPIRLAVPADAGAIAAIYAPVCRHTAISFETDPPDAAELARRMAAIQPKLPWLAYEEAGDLLGYAYARPYNERAAYMWTLESSIYLAEGARGRGVGSALYAALFRLLEAQGYRGVVAGITLPNAASVALHERFGFVAAGRIPAAGWKHGAWHDVGYWRRALGTAADPRPDPPLCLN